MKKLIAVLSALCLLCTAFAAFAEETPAFTFRNGIAFGMNEQDVLAAETEKLHEQDTDHTHGPVTFSELEYEKILIPEGNVRADMTYLFAGGKLAAIRLDYETRDISYDALKAALAADFGEFQPLDTALLGNGIYAVDDDGRPEAIAEAVVSGDVMIVMELDSDGDDMDVTFVDLTADYIK